MVFSSTVFLLLFLPVLLLVYYLPVRNCRWWRNAVILLFSLGFYAWGEPLFVWVMLLSIFVNWYLVYRMGQHPGQKKRWLSLAVAYDVLLLVVFKYLGFLSQNLAVLTGGRSPILSISLPIGISFFTFQLMSYVFDVYYGQSEAQKNPLSIALYVSLFPQLIAGPIVRYRQISSEIAARSESVSELTQGMRRFIYGLAKKVLLANFLGQIADNIFEYVQAPSVMTAWLGALAYTLQIYFDFSGYSDMAIGLGRMFGFHFPENFRYPYMAGTVTEFWHRWHISLSTWFRDYVYIPLGGSRVDRRTWVRNLFVVWLLTGIWHGANWTFVLWGLLYFVVLLLEKRTGFVRHLGKLGHLYTLLVVTVAWVLFRSSGLSDALSYVGHLFGFGSAGFIDGTFIAYLQRTWLLLLLAVIGTTPLLSGFFSRLKEKGIIWPEAVWLLLLFLVSILEVVSATYNPFIYFNF